HPLAGSTDGTGERLDLHHHPGAAPIGRVVGDPVLAFGEVAQVGDGELQQPLLLRLPQDARGQVARHHRGKERQDLGVQGAGGTAHPTYSGGSTISVPAAGSSSVTKASTRGTASSSPSLRITRVGTSPVFQISSTTPSSSPCGERARSPMRSAW